MLESSAMIAVLRRAALVLALLPFLRPLAAAETRPVTPEDYFAFETISDPRFSPDGSVVAFVKTTIDQKQNRRHGSIWTVASSGTNPPIRLMTTTQSATSPRWSPDGKSIAFLSASPNGSPGDAQKTQVWVVRMIGGEPKRVTSLTNGVTGFQWSPDGKRFACVSRTGPSDAVKSASDVRHYKHLTYKFNDSGWFDDKRAHVWIVDAASGAARQITEGEDWNDSDPQWSPDGTRIAFVSDRTGKAFDESRNTDVWVIDANGGQLTKISTSEEPDTSPRWSPDGRTIAFVNATEQRAHPKVWLAPSTGGPVRLAADDLDLIPSALQWGEGGRALYFEAGVKGAAHLFRIDLSTRRAAQVTEGLRTVRAADLHERTRRVAYLSNDPMHLDDLYVASLSGDDETQLTHVNAELWNALAMSPVERVAFKGADGWDVDGFLMKPVGWVAGKKYPMVLSIHGGPAGMYGFDWFHEFQIYAGRGWAVFFTNPRGSTGYGEKFERGVQLEWGGKAYVDIMNGVDAVLARNPWIDADRLGVTGGSYGGYMTNWIISHTNRFKAAVTLRSISNFISDDGTRDGAYGHADDFGGDIFENHDLYWRYSPLKYVKDVKTPTLILHSDNDFRVPIEQGEQWFRALRHFGVISEIVFFPRENHNLTRTGEPKHLVESINWQVYWFDRYLNGNAGATPPDAPARKATTNNQER